MSECPIIDALNTFLSQHTILNQHTVESTQPVRMTSLWVGFSGGLDSTVLLHALSRCVEPKRVTAVHVHHGLSADADEWLSHCEAQAKQWGVCFLAERVQLNHRKKGLEAAARDARYRVFSQCMAQALTGDSTKKHPSPSNPIPHLLLGHHLDDQQETLLLRLMRGAGPTGLQAIPQQRRLGEGVIVRPFLHLSRQQLHQYARQHQLMWIEDDSNADNRFDRNFLRNQLIPLLNQRWPDAASRCAQTAALCADNETLLADLAQQDADSAAYKKEALGFSVGVAELSSLTKARRHNVLRYLLRRQGFAVPEQVHLQEMDRQLGFDASINVVLSACQVRWGNAQLCGFQHRLYALPFDAHRPSSFSTEGYDWEGHRPLRLPLGALGYATLSLVQGGQWHWTGNPIRVFFRNSCWVSGQALIEPSKRMQPHQRSHSQTFKKLLQEYRVPTWLRAWVPLLQEQGVSECGAVADLWVNRGHESVQGDGYRIVWTLCPPES